jgi:hypothetical protein
MNKPTSPTFNFISPANLFSVVQRLQDEKDGKPLLPGTLKTGNTAAPSNGDPSKFQSLLNNSRS